MPIEVPLAAVRPEFSEVSFMHVQLEYCAMWNYEPQAVSLTTKLLTEFKQNIEDLKLIPSKGGCFELTVDGNLVYSKLKTGQFPDEKAILKQLQAKVK
jgi:selenoprotein W-related protein